MPDGVRYGPRTDAHLSGKLHKLRPTRQADGTVAWISQCGQTALALHQTYRRGVPLDAIHRPPCGNCFRDD